MAKPTIKWAPEVEALIARFHELGPAAEPFELAPWAQVTDPVKFHETLAREIALGPEGVRARRGSMESELKLYLVARRER